jgi:outer membrane protein OmpA-like peptidoglycan-associated protein
MRLRLPLLAALVVSGFSTTALAEQATVNFHLDPALGLGLDNVQFLSGASFKVDTTAISVLGPLAPQIEVFGLGASKRDYLDEGGMFGAGIGLRLRLFNDEQGYLWNPGTKHTGNAWGNYWVDAHFTWNSGVGYGAGFDVGTGAEFSLLDGLSVGPYAQFRMAGLHQMLVFGLSFTIGGPDTVPADSDYDNDGIRGADDKCPDEAEDKDGFEDTDGCPDKDNDKDGLEDDKDQCRDQAEDKDGVQDEDGCPETDADADGVLDAQDKCPLVKGVADNNGCPDTDKDGDTVVDRLDKCVDVKGVVENAGCPDTDADGDTVVDRLDQCVNEQGPEKNKGCPYPDTDKDGVADPFDNCPTEAGPADNQGCPAKVKQLIVMTSEKLIIKDKIYFDTNKATIQARSNALLDQVVAILKAHTEIKLMNVEGHTDNSGDAAFNKQLSEDRAVAVTAYLTKKGIMPERLKPLGYGPEKPADTNDTPAGRENNRRVEFNIVEQ